MLKIRFFRVGKKHQPSFKIVVTDRRRPPRGGRFVEKLGSWNPLTKEKTLKEERIKYWLSKGAKLSDSVYNLLIKEKVLEGKKIPVNKKGKKKAEIKESEENKKNTPAGEEIKKPKEAKPKEAKTEDAKPKEAKPKESKTEEAKPEIEKKESVSAESIEDKEEKNKEKKEKTANSLKNEKEKQTEKEKAKSI